MKDVFERYLLLLRQDRDDKTEHSDRPALQNLLEVAAHAADPGIHIIHEAKKVRGSGAPDFKVMKAAMILGYVENKTVGENLDQILKSEQIARYKALSNNILLTDYLQFIWIKDGKVNGREIIAFPDDLEGKAKKPREDRVKAVSDLLRGFFSTAPEGIGRAQQLALALATRSHFLRDFLDSELQRQEKKEHREDRLHGLYEIFRDHVFHELALGEFADAFAQMLAYGLFLAKLNSNDETITLVNARKFVPGSFRLIRELVQFLDDLSAPEYIEIRWVVEEILSIVNGLDLHAIHEDLSFKHRKAISRNVRAADEDEHRLFERDPFIYFYENFLAKYDAKMKKARGVYYTPPPIVNFIVRAVDDILKETFGITDGLADHKRVTVLDFACGTGTFILEVFERVFENIGGADSGKASLIVRDHMLKNIFGFECLIAPYTIAHLKLSQYLADKGHALADDERLQVFLTNTLELISPAINNLVPELTAEIKAAQRVKETPILVITGNPPYSGHSRNRGKWISKAIDAYKSVDGKPLGKKNPKWLNDDYVKFIRFAQMKMDGGGYNVYADDGSVSVVKFGAVEEGVVGVITNHSWLDNPTFRGMRQSLMRTFQQIYILDLHGNAKKKEHAPDGSKDENVFDIEQGVAISVFVKRPGLERRVWRGDLWGKRLAKYKIAAEESIATIVWQPIDPASPYYAFRHEDVERRAVYEKGWPLPAIFALNSVGMVTGRDRLAVHFSKSEAYGTVKRFSTLETEEARREYNLGPDAQDWKVAWAQEDIRATRTDDSRLIQIAYQPFDFRWTYYTGKPSGFHVRPRRPVSDAMLKQNLAIISNRSQEIPGDWSNVLVVRQPATHHTVSNKEVNTVFPLYTDGLGSNENFSSEFRAFLDGRYEHHYTPEEILGYIYAVLHTSTYRTCYAGFLRIDFPRVPFPELGDDFETLSGLGWGLVQAHLLRELPRHGLAGYFGKGDHTVEAVRYLPEEQAVAINKTQCFKPVPQAVWDFHIGGYQVLEKYLKSRKGRTLSLDEIRCLLSPIASPSPSSRWQGSMRHTGPPFRTGDNSTQSSHQPVYWCIMRLIRLSERSELMARTGQPDLFVTESQSDLFGAEAVPSYRPDSGKVRARLHKILAEARAAQTSPWEPTRVSLYRTIFPQMTLWLPEDEAAQLRFEFETELARLEAA